MNSKEWLSHASKILADIPNSRLDVLVLFEDVTGKDRSWLLAHPEYCIPTKIVHALDQLLMRRATHEPLAYIRGKSEFYGREFIVSADTLQPRPETETMVDSFLKLSGINSLADIGTGSGCIAITAALECPTVRVYATELNPAALTIAKKNAQIHHADIAFYEGDLLTPLNSMEIDALLCNLPYVPESHTINNAAMHEPAMAIFGGEDGLDLYRKLFLQIKNSAHKPIFILTESLPYQHQELASLAASHKYKHVSSADFIQLFQYI